MGFSFYQSNPASVRNILFSQIPFQNDYQEPTPASARNELFWPQGNHAEVSRIKHSFYESKQFICNQKPGLFPETFLYESDHFLYNPNPGPLKIHCFYEFPFRVNFKKSNPVSARNIFRNQKQFPNQTIIPGIKKKGLRKKENLHYETPCINQGLGVGAGNGPLLTS